MESATAPIVLDIMKDLPDSSVLKINMKRRVTLL